MKPFINIFRNNEFRLEKLYCDSVDDSGNCFIVYMAKLDWRFFSFCYSGLIYIDGKGVVTERSSFKKIEIPGEKLLTISIRKPGIEGTWKCTDPPLVRTLLRDEVEGELIWNCHHPKAVTEIRYSNILHKGIGYAETLVLPLMPHRLPVDEIRWGRFLSDATTVIWICWKGARPLNLLFLNGHEYSDAEFSDKRIYFGERLFCLSFSEVRVIRKGTLNDLFPGKHFLKYVIGRGIMKSMETKYIAKTCFSRNSIIITNGWSIYEEVIWKR